ncbi:diguanylate cyclase [Motilimonas cestriensis]|uniref:diguanylate cyclase n=1 Tax=Motilimonas cestriensis TaxID=2742685 RepID=A0ABS8W7M6_9GAMM|nr:diguanylate cyclase [Motilimonas cestriensis]MCE2594377.1 diguanylate cyclase [Motilimonas cestriensis]
MFNKCFKLIIYCLSVGFFAGFNSFAFSADNLLDTEKPNSINLIVPNEHLPLGFYQDNLLTGVLTDYWALWSRNTGIKVNVQTQTESALGDTRNIHLSLSSQSYDPDLLRIPLVGLKVKLYYLNKNQRVISRALQDKQQLVRLGYVASKGYLSDNVAQQINVQASAYDSSIALMWHLIQGDIDAIATVSIDTGVGHSDDLLTLFMSVYDLAELDIVAQVEPTQGELIDWISWGANLISASELQKLDAKWLSISGMWWWIVLPIVIVAALTIFMVRGVKRKRSNKAFPLSVMPFASVIISQDGKYLLEANAMAQQLQLCPSSLYKQPLPDCLQPVVNLIQTSLDEGEIVNQQIGLTCLAGSWHFFILNAKRIQQGKHYHWLCQLCRLTSQPDFRPLPQQQALLRDVLAAITSPACIKDKQGVVLACNKLWSDLFGLNNSDVIGKRDRDVLSKDELARQRPLESAAWLGQVQCGDDVVVYPMENEQQHIYALLVVLNQSQIMTRQECDAEKAQYLTASLMAMFNDYPDPVAIVTKAGLCKVANHAFADAMVQKPLPEVINQAVANILPNDKVDWNKRQHKQIFRANDSVKYEELVFLPQGKQQWLEVVKNPFVFPLDNESAILMVTHDITERKDTEQQLADAIGKLEELSFIDSLTQVANRRSFDEQLRYYWRSSISQEQSMSLILLDIDFFKPYNDNYGHQEGDQALTLVASTIKDASKRATDLVARYGGEEFVILLPDTDKDGAEHIAEMIRQAVENKNIPHAHSQVAKHITVSLGVATLTPDPDLDYDTLIEQADLALYQAKDSGRNQLLHFEELAGIVD